MRKDGNGRKGRESDGKERKGEGEAGTGNERKEKERKGETKLPVISQTPAALLPEMVRHLTPAVLGLPASLSDSLQVPPLSLTFTSLQPARSLRSVSSVS